MLNRPLHRQAEPLPLVDPRLEGLRVAVVHDWLTGMRGGEKVLEAILELFPRADLFTLFHYAGTVSPAIEAHPIHTSFLQGLATRMPDYRKLLLLYPDAIERWDLSGYDLVISSSHCVAKGVRTGGVPHVTYCHTPMRYMWDRFDDYFPASKPLLRLVASTARPWLQQWDQRSSSGVTTFIANSTFVRERIRRYYDRDAEVIHPFADESFFTSPLQDQREDYHLVVSALVPYKKIELAVEAAARGGRRLLILGDGPLLERLARSAPPNVEVAGFVSSDEIRLHLGRALSLIIPGVEDFGITAVEAAASGTPVIAYREGGVRDSVTEGLNGSFFQDFTGSSVLQAMERVERNNWDRETIRNVARQFTRERFQAAMTSLLSREIFG